MIRCCTPFLLTQLSNQLLTQTGPDVDKVILADLGRSLSALLDQAALYGNGVDQPTGVLSHPGSVKHVYVAGDPLWALGTEMEASVANAGTGIATLGSIVSPELWRRLRSESVYGPAATGGPLISRELTRPLPSPECFNTHWFCANWSAMTIGIFSLELLINPYVSTQWADGNPLEFIRRCGPESSGCIQCVCGTCYAIGIGGNQAKWKAEQISRGRPW
jgi:hypothetical protein